jgi:hypothetical protein
MRLARELRITGNIYGAMLTRHFDFLSSSFSLVYRNSRYSLTGNISSVQNSITLDVSARIIRQIYLSSGWEGLFEGKNTSGRILFSITSRL